MGKRRSRADRRAKASSGGKLTVDRTRRSGHFQGNHYSEVYRDGRVYVYTAWNDNEPEVGAPMPFEAWVRSRS